MKKLNLKKIILGITTLIALFCAAPTNAQWTSPTWNAGNTATEWTNGVVGIQTQSFGTNSSLSVGNNLSIGGAHLIFNAFSGVIDWGTSSGGDLIFRYLSTQGNINSYHGVAEFTNTGAFGVGYFSPTEKLELGGADANGVISIFRNNGATYPNTKVYFCTGMSSAYGDANTAAGDNGIIWTDGNGTGGVNSSSGFVIAPSGGSTSLKGLRIDASGKVAIGVANNNMPGSYNLYVAGGILTEQVKVATVTGGNWSDYVFGNTYNLKPLAEVEQFIKTNKHLPGVPSADDVEKDGIDMVQMDATLLKKIEELTLYVLQQQKQIDKLQSELDKAKSGRQ